MKNFFVYLIGLLLPISLSAQNPQLNPLNYSGKMYITSIEVLSTPRYVSYGDHALLHTDMNVPVVSKEVVDLDFKNNVITISQTQILKVSNVTPKMYSEGYENVVVISMDAIENNNSKSKAELVWPSSGNPYLQQIATDENGMTIFRCHLSLNFSPISQEEVLMQMLQNLY